jgi:hypothetical protein
MYTRIINNQPIWPYTQDLLRIDEPGTSFPYTITDELLSEFQVFPVVIDIKPITTYQQDAIRLDPVFEDGQWVQHWDVVDVSMEIQQERYEYQCGEVRNQRSEILKASDWTQGRDILEEVSVLWQPYRQQLRDITEQDGFPFSVVWPAPPA